MTISRELIDRRDAAWQRMCEIRDTAFSEDRDWTDAELKEWRALEKKVNRDSERIEAQVRMSELDQPVGPPLSALLESGDRPGTARYSDPAMRAVDALHRAQRIPDGAAERVELLLRTGTPAERDLSARWAQAAGSEHYRSAFVKLFADPTRGHMAFTDEERDAWRTAEQVKADVRAMSGGTDSAGGFLVPLELDPAILLSNGGSTNPLRQISRTVRITTDKWAGISSAGASAEWLAEAAQAADGSFTLAQPEIPVHKAAVFVPYSYEVGMDALNFVSELQRVLVDSAVQITNTAHTTGSGSGQPTGVITALAATDGETPTSVVAAAGEALASADVYNLQNALPPRFQPNARFVAPLSVINTLAQMETANGALKFPEIREGRLLNRPLHELSNMDGAIDDAVTASNYSLLYGDFQHFVIVDRIGAQLELIPNLMGANGRPTGQRGVFLWLRVGSDVVVPNAFRVLNVATTA